MNTKLKPQLMRRTKLLRIKDTKKKPVQENIQLAKPQENERTCNTVVAQREVAP